MKLRLGDVLIETDHIEFAEKVAPHTVKLVFVSGTTLDVHCGVTRQLGIRMPMDFSRHFRIRMLSRLREIGDACIYYQNANETLFCR